MNIHDNTLIYKFPVINITGNTAVVEAHEFYSFLYNDSTIFSVIAPKYEIRLEKNSNGIWVITRYSDDSISNFKPFNVQQQLSLMLNPTAEYAEMSFGPTEENLHSNNSTATATVEYTMNANRVTAYADNYAITPNPIFTTYSADCQNYASQCILAGLGFPMTQTAVNNKIAPCDTSGNYTWAPGTQSFIGTISFVNYLMYNTGYDETGLFGSIVTTSHSYISTEIGNVIEGPGLGADAPYGHACVVVQVGTTRDSTFVSAHSSNYRHVSLSWMFGNSSIKICDIDGYATVS